MWEQLKYYLDLHNSQKILGAHPEKTGSLIEILKTNKFFKSQEQAYGAEILQHYIMMLECYVLPNDSELMDFDGKFYVIFDGVLRCSLINRNTSKLKEYDLYETQSKVDMLSDGMVISNSYDKVKGHGQAKLLKVYRYHSKYTKQNLRLSFLQKQRFFKSKEMLRQIANSVQKQQIKEKLQKIDMFGHLSEFDLNHIVVESKLQRFPKSYITHYIGQQITKVGIIISGNIKLLHVANEHTFQKNDPDKAVLKKYLIHKHKLDALEHANITSFMTVEDCLGLEEYLWHENYVSKGEVVSVEAEIVYIPTTIFGKKFNQIVNFSIYTRIKGLIQSKKFLIDKTLKAKQQKEEDIKFSLYKKQKERQLSNSNSPLKTKISVRHHRSFNIADFVPEEITHKFFVDEKNEEKYSSIPKKEERINFFPELFQNASIPLELRDKLKFAKEMHENRNRIQKRKLSHYKQPSISPEKVLQKTLIDNLDRLEQISKEKNQKNKMYLDQFEKEQDKKVKHMTISSQRSHLNLSLGNTREARLPFITKQSIFNNFSITKDKQSRYQTLQIL